MSALLHDNQFLWSCVCSQCIQEVKDAYRYGHMQRNIIFSTATCHRLLLKLCHLLKSRSMFMLVLQSASGLTDVAYSVLDRDRVRT